MGRNLILSKDFALRSSDGKFYLSDLKCKNLIFEPYELTQNQYNILRKFDGKNTFEELKKVIKNKKLFYLLLSDLKNIGAIGYANKNQFRNFPTPSRKPRLYEAHFEFTKKCNFNCKHCYQEKYLKLKEKDLGLNEIRELTKKLKELNVVRTSLSGGEPFLGNLINVCKIFKENGIKIDCIFTNGFLIKKEDIKFLKVEGIHLYISLDGATPRSHGIMRGVKENDWENIFNKIIENIKELKKQEIVVKINTCIHKDNLIELNQMYKLMKKLKVDVWRMTIPKAVGKYHKNKNTLSVNKTLLYASLIDLISSFLKDVEKTDEGINVPLDLRIASIFKTEMLIRPMIKYSQKNSSCDYQKERITIKPNGDIVPCGLLVDHVVGNIRKDSLEKIWKMKKLQKLKNISIGDIKECKTCNYAYLCGGGCRVNSLEDYGDLFHKDRYACECMDILFGPVKELINKEGFILKTSGDGSKKIQIRNKELFF